MNKKILVLINSLILSSSVIIADDNDPYENFGGFVGDNRSDIVITNWECEYCAEVKKWEFQLDATAGINDESPYHYGNYSDLGHSNQLLLGGEASMQDGEGGYWKTTFQNLGVESGALQSDFGQKGSYSLKLDLQRIPIRKYDQLVTPFTNPGSSTLQLPSDWVRSDNGTFFGSINQNNTFHLGTDWDRLGLSFNLTGDSNFEFNTSFHRLKKEGLREFSATQMLSATYLPFPVNQTTDDFNASVYYNADQWYASFAVKISKFNNAIESVSYQSPFSPLVGGSDVGNLSTAPDNLSTTLILNARYYYAPKSSAKIHYSTSRLTQNQTFLPYTTNTNLIADLPQTDLDGEVITQDLTVQLRHWFNSQWTFMAKYRNRDRDNRSDQMLFQPVVTDLYTAGQLMNIPYDYSKESINAQLDYHLFSNQLLSFNFNSDKKVRNFQSVHQTTEDGYTAKYRATFSENIVLMVKGEKFYRDGTAPDLIDFLGVDENPLMQRYNVSDREQNKINFQLFYSPFENFSTAISGYYSEQDYNHTELGLTDNQQENLNIDFTWQINTNFNMSIFMQKEEVKTGMAGSNAFASPDWYGNNIDEVNSYGFNFSYKGLLDDKLDIFVDFNRSDADTQTTIVQNNINDPLPEINSLWSQAEVTMKYLYSDDLNFSFSYQHHKFQSNDFTIDGINPGSLTNLVTFGALSNNYNVNYVSLTASYTF